MTFASKLRALAIAAALALGFSLIPGSQPAQAQWGVYYGNPGYGYHQGWRHQRRWDRDNYYRGPRCWWSERRVWRHGKRVVRRVRVCR